MNTHTTKSVTRAIPLIAVITLGAVTNTAHAGWQSCTANCSLGSDTATCYFNKCDMLSSTPYCDCSEFGVPIAFCVSCC